MKSFIDLEVALDQEASVAHGDSCTPRSICPLTKSIGKCSRTKAPTFPRVVLSRTHGDCYFYFLVHALCVTEYEVGSGAVARF